MLGLTVRYPVPDPEDDLDRGAGELEEGWAEDRLEPEEWPVETAARVFPVFRFLSGRAVDA